MTDQPGPVVAVIPARGGSKGVVGKNLRLVGGVSLVGRAVASARNARLIDEVYVSTDDDDISATARAAGARVVNRPATLASDTASSEAALLHALDAMLVEPEILVFIQATSPFIDPGDLDAAIARVRCGEADVVFSAKLSHAFIWRNDEDGAVGVNHDASFRLRRQDSEAQYQETGAFYVMRVHGFRTARFRFFGLVAIAVVPELTAIEVDSEADLEIAQAIASLVSTSIQEEPWSPSALIR